MRSKRLQSWLANAPTAGFVGYAIVVAFTTYFCMYAFRKPFAAATFEGLEFGPIKIDLKTALAISQIIGYASSKYVGIRVCSEVGRSRLAIMLVALICWAECALVLFGLLPGSWKALAIFLNGLPLGMVWGLVVRYLEGRRTSELLLAGLSCSYIVASSMVKDVGRGYLSSGVSEFWMPAVTGATFLPLFLLVVWLLNHLPTPDEADVDERVERVPMTARERWSFVRRFSVGMALLLLIYFFLTAYRDFRDTFAVEILRDLGYTDGSTLLTRADLPAAFFSLLTMGLLYLVKDARRGFILVYVIMAVGTALLGGATLLLDAGAISGFTWVVLSGIGCYLAYVPYGSVLFDRLIMMTRSAGTAVFAIYLSDAIGYTGSISLMLYEQTGEMPKSEFFKGVTYAMSIGATGLFVVSCTWFLAKHGARRDR